MLHSNVECWKSSIKYWKKNIKNQCRVPLLGNDFIYLSLIVYTLFFNIYQTWLILIIEWEQQTPS